MLFRSSESQLLRLESSKLFYRHLDAQAFLSSSTTDALLDSSYAACGCGVNAPTTLSANFSLLLTNYFNNATSVLNDSAISVNYSFLAIPSPSISSCNSTTTYTLNYTLETNSTFSRKSTSVLEMRNLTLYKNATALAINSTVGNTTFFSFIVTCS